MNRGLIVACYTEGDYEREAHERLIPSLERLDLPHDVRKVESRGSWVANGFACQIFLQGICKEYPDTNILFLDVDAVVHFDPWKLLSTISCDVAAHLYRGRELLTGTLYLPFESRRDELLTKWIAKNERYPHEWDQRNLQRLLNQDRTFRFVSLPAEYCCIFDTQRKLTPSIVPVIEHFQASRKYRRREQ